MASMCGQCATRYHPDHFHGNCQCACNVADSERGVFNQPEGFVNVPMQFEGTEEEIEANFRTHDWHEGECEWCAAKKFGSYAFWPCDTDVPRRLVRLGTPESEAAQKRIIVALAAREAEDQ